MSELPPCPLCEAKMKYAWGYASPEDLTKACSLCTQGSGGHSSENWEEIVSLMLDGLAVKKLLNRKSEDTDIGATVTIITKSYFSIDFPDGGGSAGPTLHEAVQKVKEQDD